MGTEDDREIEETLIPKTPLTLEQYMRRVTLEGSFRAACQFFGDMTEETLDHAVMFESYAMLDKRNVSALAGVLTRMAVYPELTIPRVAESIMDHLLQRALAGTSSECRAILKLILAVMAHRSFVDAECEQYVLGVIRQCLLNDIPMEYEVGLKGKAGCRKLYYAREVIPYLNSLVTTLHHAIFIFAILFVTNVGNGQDAVISVIHKLIPWMDGAIITLQAFDTVCGLLITIREEKLNWGRKAGGVKEVPASLKLQLEMRMGSFLSSLKSKEGLSREILHYLNKRFSQAFQSEAPELNAFNKANGGEWASSSVTHETAEAEALEVFFPKLCKVLKKSNSLLHKTKKKPVWQEVIDDLSKLLYYGAAQNLFGVHEDR